MATSHILTSIEPSMMSVGSPPVGMQQNSLSPNGYHPNNGNSPPNHIQHLNGNGSNYTNSRSPDQIDRNLNVSLDDRDLWMRFQNLTNEMIVTKNGRYVKLFNEIITIFIYYLFCGIKKKLTS